MKTYEYIVVEDEPLVAKMLVDTISQIRPAYILLNIFGTIRECVSFFQNNHNEEALIFMDIELSDGQCFEIFNKCKVGNPVIFTTSHDEWAIKAFKVNSIDYLLKPIDDRELLQAIEKYEERSFYSSSNILKYISLATSASRQQCFQDRILVSYGNQYKAIEASDIAFFEADDKYVCLFTFSENKYLVNYTLKELAEMLSPKIFHRLSRSYIVNRAIINEIRKYDQGRLIIYLRSPYQTKKIMVSASQRDAFLDWYGR